MKNIQQTHTEKKILYRPHFLSSSSSNMIIQTRMVNIDIFRLNIDGKNMLQSPEYKISLNSQKLSFHVHYVSTSEQYHTDENPIKFKQCDMIKGNKSHVGNVQF